MRILPKLVFACGLLVAGGAGAVGTNGGGGFSHFVKESFDFHVASPPEWSCNGCDAGFTSGGKRAATTSTWTIRPQDSNTSLKVDFISDYPAETEEELHAELDKLPGGPWLPFCRGSSDDTCADASAFVGFTNAPLRDNANEATEYYLVEKRMVIRIEWQKDANAPARALELDAVKASIDRASAPPRVRSIESEGAATVKPGDTACIRIVVDDLRRKFVASSIKALEFDGLPSHWSIKKISWLSDESTFKVCVGVTAAFTATGLQITSLGIEDFSGRMLTCKRTSTAPYEIGCGTSGASSEPRTSVVSKIAAVDNPAPDLEGPEIRGVTVDKDALTVSLDASDPAGIYAAELFFCRASCNGQQSVIIYSDQFAHGGAFSIAGAVSDGWNLLDSLVIYDKVGNATFLRRSTGTTYELVPWKGAVRTTVIPIQNFLKTPEVRR